MKRLVNDYRRNVETFLFPKKEKWTLTQRLRREAFLMRFSHWLVDNDIRLMSLRYHHLELFTKTETAFSDPYKALLMRYLKWLKSNGYPELELTGQRSLNVVNREDEKVQETKLFQSEILLLNCKNATGFLNLLKINHAKGTCRSYRSSLESLYLHLEENNVKSLGRIRRSHIESWLIGFNGYYAATTKTQRIIHVRTYFYWLYENKLLRKHPSELIDRRDFPKLPKYLPRPLRPEEDELLQKILNQSNSIYAMGLLVLRKTGMRIGDLINLEYHCLHQSSQGIYFLKTPLGKLKKEHLIPIDQETEELIGKIQSKTKEMHFSPTNLFHGERTVKVPYSVFAKALEEATESIECEKKITLHRLRHTYATTMLNAGVSLPGVMNLLGHADYRMTLRYAQITQKTVTEEYFKAIEKIKTHLNNDLEQINQSFNPLENLKQIQAWLKNQEKLIPKNKVSLLKKLTYFAEELNKMDVKK